MALGTAVISYAGQLNLTAVADRDRCPDIEVFAEGVRRALGELTQRDIPAIRAPGQPPGETPAGSRGRTPPARRLAA